MNTYIHEALDEFFDAFEPSRDLALWMRLVREEQNEAMAAIIDLIENPTQQGKADLLKEMCDLMYVICGAMKIAYPLGLDIDVALYTELMEIVVTADDLLKVSDGVKEEAFWRVHASNMSKLVDGRPIRREDGKILKGPNYKPPVLTDLVA
jgi:predicted HAD superfamily Cof-like phosphohydrolase